MNEGGEWMNEWMNGVEEYNINEWMQEENEWMNEWMNEWCGGV